MEIIGKYKVAKALFPVNDELGFFTREEILADLEKRLASGEADAHDAKETTMIVNSLIEFTEDYQVKTWMELPEGLSQKEIDKAVKAGYIREMKDGYFLGDENKTWKEEDGKFFYDTKQKREIDGQKLSSWDEIKFDEDGLLDFGHMMKLAKI